MTRDDVFVVFRALRDLLLPRTCATCGEPVDAGVAGRFCASCLIALDDLEMRTACSTCAQPLAGRRCRKCRPRNRAAAPFEAAAAYGPFEGVLRRAIHVLKFEREPGVGAQLGRLLGRAARRLPEADVVVPVPLHFTRLLVRRYNQSAVLARHASRALGKPLVLDALVRTRGTVEQSGSTRTQRRENVRDAFVARRDRVAGRTVVLVDDVLTTGATARACVKALEDAGAARVYVAALARAKDDSPW